VVCQKDTDQIERRILGHFSKKPVVHLLEIQAKEINMAAYFKMPAQVGFLMRIFRIEYDGDFVAKTC
jgi:hypothetical protein